MDLSNIAALCWPGVCAKANEKMVEVFADIFDRAEKCNMHLSVSDKIGLMKKYFEYAAGIDFVSCSVLSKQNQPPVDKTP